MERCISDFRFPMFWLLFVFPILRSFETKNTRQSLFGRLAGGGDDALFEVGLRGRRLLVADEKLEILISPLVRGSLRIEHFFVSATCHLYEGGRQEFCFRSI